MCRCAGRPLRSTNTRRSLRARCRATSPTRLDRFDDRRTRSSSEKALSQPPIGRRARLDLVAAHEQIFVEVLRKLARLCVPEENRIAELHLDSTRKNDRRLHFARALDAEKLRAG